MASSSRKTARKGKKPAKGKVIPLHKRKAKKAMMNEGGFYDGMPGCTIDKYGNRKTIEFVIMPNGYHTTMIYAHPQFLKKAIEGAMETNKEVRAIVQGACFDRVFKERGLLNWIICKALARKRKKAYKVMIKEQNKLKEEDAKDQSNKEA